MRILTETKEWMGIPLRTCKRKTPSRKWNKFEDMCSLFIEDILTRPNICTRSALYHEDEEEFEYSYKMYLNGIVTNDRPISRLKAMYCITDCIPDSKPINLINVLYNCGMKYYDIKDYKFDYEYIKSFEYTKSTVESLYKKYGIRSIYIKRADPNDNYYTVFIKYTFEELNAVWGKKGK